MPSLVSFSPDSLIPFSTYRTPRQDQKGFLRGAAEISATLVHFYFAERFRGRDEVLRKEVLSCPSASEARKIAQRSEPDDRWLDKRLALVKAALWMQFTAAPYVAAQILDGSLPIGTARPLGKGWEPRRQGNERWERTVRKMAQAFVSSERMCLLATGDTDVFNPFLFSTRLASLLGDRQPNELIICCRRGVDAMAEQWAIDHCIPVQHFNRRPGNNAPVSSEEIDTIVSVSTHAFILSRGEDKTITALLGALRSHNRIPTRFVRLDQDGKPISRKAPVHAATGKA